MYNKGDYLILSEESEQSSKLISKLTFEHFLNVLSKKDRNSNRIVDALCEEYGSSFVNVENELNNPLTYFIDSIEDAFLYTKRHIKGVISKPRSAIVKEEYLIPKEKITVIDGKMFKWLANKPGANFKEKLANLNKVKSTRKIYSYNIKENQVFYSYLIDLKHYFHDKEKLIENNPGVFGDISQYIKTIKERKTFIDKAIAEFTDTCPDVVAKNYSTPNNALISDENYSPIWRSYRFLKTNDFGIKKEFDYQKQVSFLLSILIKQMIFNSESVEISDYPQKLDDEISKVFLYSIEKNVLNHYCVKDGGGSFYISIDKYNLSNPVLSLLEGIKYSIDIKLTNKYKTNRGIPFSMKIGEDEIDSFFDISGIYECSSFVYDYLPLTRKNKNKSKTVLLENSFLSINDFSNFIYSGSNSNSVITNQLVGFTYPIHSKILFGDDALVTLHAFLDDEVSKAAYLKYVSTSVKSDYVIYDVSDILDEFTSANLRNGISSSFPLSYPVWRSILAAESFGNTDIKNVFDFVGEESYLSRLDKKNDLFIHIGPSIFAADFDMMSEKELQQEYLIRYFKKNNITFDKKDIESIILYGGLHGLFTKQDDSFFVFSRERTPINELIKISFDSSVFSEVSSQFVSKINELLGFYTGENNLLILPDYLPTEHLSKYNHVFNKELHNGAIVIRNRLKNGQVTWYEKLPNLSLEVVKNGLWDDLVLTKNREEENVIGKSVNINVNDTFTLKAGQMEYRLPLRKSFIGESNKDFYVVLRHKSFPLHNDVDVKLKLIYEYGSKESYRLIFTPTKENPYFKEIEAIWEKDTNFANYHLFKPTITDVDYNEELADRIHADVFLKLSLYLSDEKICYKDDFWIKKYVTNRIHRLYVLDFKDYKKAALESTENMELRKLIKTNIHNLRFVRDKSENEYQKRTDIFRLHEWEQMMAVLTLDEKLLTNHYYEFPQVVFGRYLATESSNKTISTELFNFLSNLYSKEEIGIDGEKYHYPHLMVVEQFLDRLTAASAINHKFMVELYDSDSVCAREISKTLLNAMRFLKESNFQGNFKRGYLLMARVVELLIPFIFLREKVGMESYLPDGRGAKEIIYCLKEFVRNYNLMAPSEKQKTENNGKEFKGFATKLRITGIELPKELEKVPFEIYVLYLFLSGSEEAGKVTVCAN